MKDTNSNRRSILKGTGTTLAGLTGLGLSQSVAANEDGGRRGGRGRKNGESDRKSAEKTNVQAENYVETENYVYRRVKTPNTDILAKIEVDSGKVTYADVDKSGVSAASATNQSLKNRTKSIVNPGGGEQSLNPASPTTIVTGDSGVSVQASPDDPNEIFRKTNVRTDNYESCDSFTDYNNHWHAQVAMQTRYYSFDGLLETVGMAAVCDILFVLIGKRVKWVKKALRKISDHPAIRVIPDAICSFIFNTLLGNFFDGNTATFGFWDVDGGWFSEPKIAFGASGRYDPSMSYMRNNQTKVEVPGFHIENFR